MRYFFAILFVFLCLANMAKAEICNDLIEVNSIYDKVFLKSASVKDVRTLQKYVGAAQDGKWGPKSDAAYAQLLDRCDSVKTRPTKLLLDIVRQRRSAESLSDTELCESLKYVDLESTYYEMKSRNLDCLNIAVRSKNWQTPNKEEAFRFLKQYQKQYQVQIPAYIIHDRGLTFPKREKSLPIYIALNQSFLSHAAERFQQEEFCTEWFPQVATIVENQTKNLDGSIGWSEGTLTGAFVECEQVFGNLAYRALFDGKTRRTLQNAIDVWVKNDTPIREQQTGLSSFSYTLFVNRIFIIIEMLHSDFDWEREDYDAVSKWMMTRALELLPGDKEDKWNKLSEKCELQLNKSGLSVETCQNGGIYQAQALLRAGIFTKDRDLIDAAYLAFHRFMSGVRNDGSIAHDSIRGCTAAAYNLWASQFLSDFVYLWSTIGEPLWEHNSFNRGTPAEAVEYSLSLFDNWEKINQYTFDSEWQGCGENFNTRQQQIGEKDNSKRGNLVSFAPYFFMTDQERFVDLIAESYDRYDTFSYVKQSGIAYEAALLADNPAVLQKILAKKNTALVNAQQFQDIVEGKSPVRVLSNLGLGVTIDARYRLLKPDLVDVGDVQIVEISRPSWSNTTTKYRLKFSHIDATQSASANKETIVSNGNVVIFEEEGHSKNKRNIMMSMRDIFNKYPDAEKAWKKVSNICQFSEDLRFDEIELPIAQRESLDPAVTCIDQNLRNDRLKMLIAGLIKLGSDVDLTALSEAKNAAKNSKEVAKVLKLQWSIALSDEDYKANLEAEDVIFLNKNYDIIDIKSTDVSREGISGRSDLEYDIIDGNLKIKGVIFVLGGERLFVNFSQKLTANNALMKTFGAQDKLLLDWKFQN
ncbi:MAG: alginate lyase family protein [Paracoccaceae bacterium]